MAPANDRERYLDAWLALTGEAPAADGPLRLPVLSGSMLPLLVPGRDILILPAVPGDCRCGDVVVLRVGERLLAHRLLLKWSCCGRDLIFEKGDRNPRGRWRQAVCIRGRVVGLADGPAIPPASLSSPALARISLAGHWRERLLAGPRRLRDRLLGRHSRPPEVSDE